MILLVLITCIVTSNETTYLYLRSLLLKIQNTIQKYVYIHDIHGIDAIASAAPPAAAGGKKKGARAAETYNWLTGEHITRLKIH